MELCNITARGLLFETLSENLITALKGSGFVVVGKLDLQREQGSPYFKYEVIVGDLPRVSAQMTRTSPSEGVILPACISLIESYPGEVSMVIANPSEYLTAEDSQLAYLAKSVSLLLQPVVRRFARDENVIPDLVTSWG